MARPPLLEWRWRLHDSPLTATERGVLRALSEFMDTKGFCFVTRTRIAHAAGRSEKAVYNAVKAAEREGYLLVKNAGGRRRFGLCNEYQAATNREPIAPSRFSPAAPGSSPAARRSSPAVSEGPTSGTAYRPTRNERDEQQEGEQDDLDDITF